MSVVTSAVNPRFRELLRLAESARHRREAGCTLLDGPHLLAAWIERAGAPPLQLVISRDARDKAEIATLLDRLAPQVPLELAPGLFGRLSPVATPTGILAVIPVAEPPGPPDTGRASLLLERIQDPGNLGSLLRSAAAAGIGQVLLSPDCTDAWSPRALRAGMGAQFLLEIHAGLDLVRFATAFGGRVVATDQAAAAALYELDLTGAVALAFGSEGGGLSAGLRAAATDVVGIPMPGPVESLNVAAAGAICLFERVRQLRQARTPCGNLPS